MSKFVFKRFTSASTPDLPVDCVLTKFVRSAMNKVKCPVYSLCWTPEGKRLITGASSGEFTLWNGTAFNFETILQILNTLSEDFYSYTSGERVVKFFNILINYSQGFFCPTDVKLVTGSDDATARVWDFARCNEESVLRGHGADVRQLIGILQKL
ncbi:hypothetical protein Mgra_00005796 [Meloidogyne graminicola]|uniref:WD_REPEATS_REGION domain-containing protein n=1 Tax=Meloidogyne graminicola TaxID=189291 RepID=A0A8S9ZNH2_9BILA|nr:hypothetical protein Mgra_00005796 [Meloidogyne graminicola]